MDIDDTTDAETIEGKEAETAEFGAIETWLIEAGPIKIERNVEWAF